jgi:hypothetical protein
MTYSCMICMFLLLNCLGILTQEYRVQVNKRISHHHLLTNPDIPGNLRGLLEQGIQVSKDSEEAEFKDSLFMSIGYAGSIETSLWTKIKEDRAKLVWLSSSIMTILIPDLD